MTRVPDELEKKPVEVWSEPLNPPEEMGPPQPLEETNLNPSPPSIQGKTSLPSQKKQTNSSHPSNLRRNTHPQCLFFIPLQVLTLLCNSFYSFSIECPISILPHSFPTTHWLSISLQWWLHWDWQCCSALGGHWRAPNR